jgi:hypothetical protein
MNTDHSYLDIFPSQRVARQLNEEDPECRFAGKVISDTIAYMNIMEEENLHFLKQRQAENLGSTETYKFLRSHERTRNSKLILQYLCTFLSQGLPLEAEIRDKPVNPFEQIRMFALFKIDLIKEKDVTTAILREHERLGLLNDTNSWYYRGQVDRSHKTLREAIESAEAPTVDNYRKVFLGLQKLSTFWFSVRNEEIKRIRKSDLFTYRLTRYLLEKYK